MNETPAISPAVGPPRSITYEFTRWDLFANWMTVIFRNRILRVFMPVMMVLTGWLDLGPGFLTRSFLANMFAAGVSVAEFLGAIAIFQTLVALANAFLLKHGGVVGQHVLEITEQGLVERTDCNETLHRWPFYLPHLHAWRIALHLRQRQ